MKWVYFKKEHRGMVSAETYFPITEGKEYLLGENGEENLRMLAEDWASDVNKAGANTEFSYSWDIVECPPKLWLEKAIEKAASDIETLRKNINMYANALPGSKGISLAEERDIEAIVNDNVDLLRKETGLFSGICKEAIRSNPWGKKEDWLNYLKQKASKF